MTGPMKSLLIYILDDSPSDVARCQRMLNKIPDWDCEVVSLQSSDDLWAVWPAAPYDLLMVDYNLGMATGLDVLRKIRADGDQRPVIALTGQGSEHVAAELSREGADDYLTKDALSPELLRVAIEGAMRRSEHRHEKAMVAERLHHAERMESISVLAAGLAHDFNNILTGMTGNLDLALQLCREDAQRVHLERADHGGRELAAIVKQLLDLQPGQEQAMTETDLSVVLAEMKTLLAHRLPISCRVDIQVPDAPLTVNANLGMIHQLVINLVLNASEAMQHAGTIVLSAADVVLPEPISTGGAMLDAGHYALVQVIDSGPGVDTRIQDEIFKPYFTTKTLTSERGAGLGLATAWKIVEAHGGQLGFENNPSGGATFNAYFPRTEAEHPKAPAKRPATERSRGSGSVLVVDDDTDIREYIAHKFRDKGYTAHTAADGRIALDMFQAHRDELDLVVLDLSMPRLGGEEVLAEIRRVSENVRVLICTGHDVQKLSKRLRRAGADGFIQKPFKLAAFFATVDSVLAPG